jgi:hypothetical protein
MFVSVPPPFSVLLVLFLFIARVCLFLCLFILLLHFPLFFFLTFVCFVFAFSFASLSLRFSLCLLLYLFSNIICLSFVFFLSCSLTVCPLSVSLHGRSLSAPELCLRAKFMNIAFINKRWDSCLWASRHSIFNVVFLVQEARGWRWSGFIMRGGCGLWCRASDMDLVDRPELRACRMHISVFRRPIES